MSLLDDHLVPHEHETWVLADDPTDEAPIWWPEDRSDPDQAFPP